MRVPLWLDVTKHQKSFHIIDFLFESFINSLSEMIQASFFFFVFFFLFSGMTVRARKFNLIRVFIRTERHDSDRQLNAPLTTLQIYNWQIKIKEGGLRTITFKIYGIILLDRKKKLSMPRNYCYLLFFFLFFVLFYFCDCERVGLGFTASSAVVGGVPDVFIPLGGEWNFSTNQKAGKRINVNRNYFRITYFSSAL